MGKVKYVSELVDQWRVQHRYTNSDMAYIMNVHPKYWGQIAGGRNAWPWHIIQKLHHKLGIPAKDLLDADPDAYHVPHQRFSRNKVAPMHWGERSTTHSE